VNRERDWRELVEGFRPCVLLFQKKIAVYIGSSNLVVVADHREGGRHSHLHLVMLGGCSYR
jgi:hypothetical protein